MFASPRSSALSPTNHYNEAARFYELEHRDIGADIFGYHRRGASGPLLVLGCGTGRICRGLEGTRSITGLDASPEMLALATGGARYVLGDMRDFDLGTFAEVIIPNGGFCFLPTRRDQTACLLAVWRALGPGAPLTLDLPMPDFRLLAIAHSPEAEAWRQEVDGTIMRRTREVFRSPIASELLLIDRYYIDERCVGEARLPLRLVFPNEIEWILEACGFVVNEMLGDHVGGPLREGCPRLVVRALRL